MFQHGLLTSGMRACTHMQRGIHDKNCDCTRVEGGGGGERGYVCLYSPPRPRFHFWGRGYNEANSWYQVFRGRGRPWQLQLKQTIRTVVFVPPAPVTSSQYTGPEQQYTVSADTRNRSRSPPPPADEESVSLEAHFYAIRLRC